MAKEGTPFGRYVLERRLALGGMAEIFLARQEGPAGFSRELVIKRILAAYAEDPNFVAMFLDEAKLAAQLSHPNIVPIYDFGEAEGAYFLAMELVRGPDIARLLRASAAVRRPLSFPLIAKIAAGVAEGLQYAHQLADPEGNPLQIVHRDISPTNILVSYDGVSKILDFGIAKASSRTHQTQAGMLKGKIAYMPPEQLLGKGVDGRADLYALGVVLYEMTTGAQPFTAESDFELMRIVVDGAPPPPPRQYNADVPADLERIILTAMAPDRDRRYRSAREMAGDLERFVLSYGGPVSSFDIAEYVRQLRLSWDQPLDAVGTSAGRSGPRTVPSRPQAPPASPPSPAAEAPVYESEEKTLTAGVAAFAAPEARAPVFVGEEATVTDSVEIDPSLTADTGLDAEVTDPGGGTPAQAEQLMEAQTRLFFEAAEPAPAYQPDHAVEGYADGADDGYDDYDDEPRPAGRGWLWVAGGAAAVAAAAIGVMLALNKGSDAGELGAAVGAERPAAAGAAAPGGASDSDALAQAGSAGAEKAAGLDTDGNEAERAEGEDAQAGSAAAGQADAARAEAERAEAARAEAERAEAEQAEAARAEAERVAAEKARREAQAQADRERVARERAERAERQQAERDRARTAQAERSRTTRVAAAKPTPLPAPQPAGTGFVLLKTTPWTEVWHGGAKIGVTPVRLELPAGNQKLVLKNAEAGLDESITIAVKAGETQKRALTLGRGTLVLLVKPSGEIFIDGKRHGITPMPPVELPAGAHTVEVVNPATGVRVSRSVRIEPGKTEKLKVVLTE